MDFLRNSRIRCSRNHSEQRPWSSSWFLVTWGTNVRTFNGNVSILMFFKLLSLLNIIKNLFSRYKKSLLSHLTYFQSSIYCEWSYEDLQHNPSRYRSNPFPTPRYQNRNYHHQAILQRKPRRTIRISEKWNWRYQKS